MNTPGKISDTDIRDAFFDEVYAIAKKDPDVVFLTADMTAFSLNKFKDNLPGQYFNIGVAEQNLVSIAAGLALGGKKVFIYSITPFVTQRCYEQVKNDLCDMQLPVTIIGSGPGIAYNSDGPTHHAIQDIAIMRALTGLTILSPADSITASAAAGIAYQSQGPVYIRLDKGKLPLLYGDKTDFSKGLAQLKSGDDVTLIATGVMVPEAFKAAAELAKYGINAGIIDIYRIKPVNENLLVKLLKSSGYVVTLEEHLITGGLGSIVCEILADHKMSLPVKRIAIPDIHYSDSGHGDREWMYSLFGLDTKSIVKTILKEIKSNRSG